MELRIKGTDTLLNGTKEVIEGVALVQGIEEDGTPIYVGETQVHWNSQRTVLEDGKVIWVTEDGKEIALNPDQIENVPDE
ncbi:hypothetical protein TK90_2622 (plasmid) [Thioalkalivibrio sp. K90mix]|uniref:hypothetical protein n=1 Tax=Thioalkalivibrio sp. (strain K90mix) TaxID=396595 RepID=UPI000195AB28|nr:hypothetical protein [Thioalkalivibrio sp. K90mix]ADC73109.1 hypothetical protein TK90_2622 [Thioalkalivibrio sp. K90mix]